jgi:hypothetical protein
MTLNPNASVLNPELVSGLVFPVVREQDDAKRIFAEYAILGGMLQGQERFIRSGANVDWTHPMSEAIARACVEAWERHGMISSESWECASGAYLSRYTGRSHLCDIEMAAWCEYLKRVCELQFAPEEQGAA